MWRDDDRGFGGRGRGRGRGRGDRDWGPTVRDNYTLQLPPGWEDCPPFGEPLRLPNDQPFRVIPSKVPLEMPYQSLLRHSSNTYTLRDAVHLVERAYDCRVGMVLDLTNSNRYYNFQREFPDALERELLYVKVPCRGRGQSPSPEAVNAAVFEIYRFMSYKADEYVLVHCTHGFNRTGYIITCAAVRLAADVGMTVERAVRRFAQARPPGIYKDAYINDLFKYHHEMRLPQILTPPVPPWKGIDEEEDADAVDAPPEAAPKEVRHEVIEELGEPIPLEEAAFLRDVVYEMLTGQPPPQGRLPHFPGSQPVSLARSNLPLIAHQRYWVSWKADGTRYLLLILQRGCYLIDRSFKIVRVQMRFPRALHGKPGEQLVYPVGKPHDATLLDGEMVVDTDQGNKYRRYLVYDMGVLLGKPITQECWFKRFTLVQEEVINPRNRERSFIQGVIPKEKYKARPINYDYSDEPFSVRIKEFWPLWRARKVINEMIPALSHESDGLILQSCDSQYVANTDAALLKFKFAHLNSVDFKLQVQGTREAPVYTLWLIDSSQRRVRGARGPPLRSIPTAVEFPEGIDGYSMEGAIIECTWLADKQAWLYHRTRVDKDTPNAYHVYEKVMASIADDIKEEPLVQYLDQVFWNTQLYEKDQQQVPAEKVPQPLPPPPTAELLPPPAAAFGPPAAAAAGGGGEEVGMAMDQFEEDQEEGEPLPDSWAPWSPPYYGPEPTPPHDPKKPVTPDMWTLHDPATYPQHLLLPPPPPPPEGEGGEQHGDGMNGGYPYEGHLHLQEGPQGQGQAHHTHPERGHGRGRYYRPDPDINPYYTEPEELQGGLQGAGGHTQAQPLQHVSPADANGGGAATRQGISNGQHNMQQQLPGMKAPPQGGGDAAGRVVAGSGPGPDGEAAQVGQKRGRPKKEDQPPKVKRTAVVQYDDFEDLA